MNAIFKLKTQFWSLPGEFGLAAEQLITLFLTGLRNTIKRGVQSYCPTGLFQSWGILVICFLVPTSFFITGCQNSQKTTMVRIRSSAEPNQVIELTGQAAKDYTIKIAEVQAANMQTAKGRQNEMLAELKKVLPWLVLALVAGLIFWGYTRSRYGWVIPSATAGGTVFILAVGRWAEWITAGVILIALGLLIWKCIEYQRERNANGFANRIASVTNK